MKLQDMQPSHHSNIICELLLLAIIELLLGYAIGTRIQEMEVLKEIPSLTSHTYLPSSCAQI